MEPKNALGKEPDFGAQIIERFYYPTGFGCNHTGRFIMFSVTTNICNKKTKGPTLMELFTASRQLKKFFF
jgi:hypothetical protein